MEHSVTALLPCRAGSKRIPQKNTKPFTKSGLSLLEIKLSQLTQLDFLHEIFVSSDDRACEELTARSPDPRVTFTQRPSELCQDDTNLSDLISYFGDVCSGDSFLWTHTTSPFLGVGEMEIAYTKYCEGLEEGHDSLFSAEKIQDYAVFKGKPINFGGDDFYWPRTQDLDPVYRVTSGLFVGGTSILRERRNRIGANPIIFEVSRQASVDIDWPEEFEDAAALYDRLESFL